MGDINKSPNLPTGIQTTDKLWVGRDAQGPYQISVGDLVNLVSESVEPTAQPGASVPLTADTIVDALTDSNRLNDVKRLVGNDVAKPAATSLVLDSQATHAPLTVTGPTTINVSGTTLGAKADMLVISNGTNAPVISGADEWSNSLGYLNTLNAANRLEAWYDGMARRYAWSRLKSLAGTDSPSPAPSPVTPSPSPSPSPTPSPSPSPSPAPAPSPIPAPAPVGSNPVTYAIAGLRTWQVYTDAELDAVPWATLGAGDVVNIYHRAEPYRKIIRVRAKGTQALPVIINGVTDANGNRPVFHGQNATVAAGCVTSDSNSVFNPTNADAWQYREAIGLIGTANGISDPYDQQWPEHVQWLNFEITGCKDGNSWTDARGVSHTWNQASGFRVQNGKWIVVDNCVIHGNDFGYFTQSQGPTEGTATQNPVVRNSRIYGNGMVNRYTEHNMYVQGQGPLIEGNFIGGLIPGALGSAYKSRASGEVFRYNTVLAAQRLVDFVEPEEQAQGLNIRADQPFVHCYGNLFVNDFDAPGGGAVQAIHIGQDKWQEEGGSSSAQVTDADLVMTKSDGQGGTYEMTAAPRHTLFFYNNTVIFRGTTAQTWRANIFDLSLAGTATRPRTTVHEWNNAYKLIGNTNWTLVEYAGHVEHRGGSLWDVGSGMALHHDSADPSRVSTNGTRPAATLAVDTAAWSLTVPAGTPYIPINMPAGWRPELATVDRQPAGFGFNGTVSRASVNKAGAFE